MKRLISFLITLLSLVFTACHHSDKKTSVLLNKSNLLSQLFTIYVNRDTVLTTANGAFITIPQGALSNNGNETAQLEIKEAYSMEQIIMAGLTTQSNGQPLSSGGMIYINAAGGQSIKITKSISIKIPTPSVNKKMQVFKGDKDENGNINWIDPDSLPGNPQTIAFDNGKILFNNNCSSCHNTGSEGTGPALAHILAKTPDKKLLYDYTRNNTKVMAEGNQYYRCLYEKWNKTAMNLFTSLTDHDLDDLYGYIENESKVRNLPIIKDEIRPCIDSCHLYREIKDHLETEKEKLSQEKIKMVIEEVVPPLPSIDTTGPPEKVSPGNNQSLYYQFNIEAFGWYNIDIFLKDNNSVESSLMVRISGEYKYNISLYLVIPSAKVYEPGGLLKGEENTYGFYKTDGTIWLPQNITAYIFALGESDDKIVFSKKEFSTSNTMNFELSPSIVTKDFFNASFKELSGMNIQFSAKDTQNADTLRKIIKGLNDVEKIKPKNCDCDCGLQNLDTSRSAAPVNEYMSSQKK